MGKTFLPSLRSTLFTKSILAGALLFPAVGLTDAGDAFGKIVKGQVVSVTDNEPLSV